MPQPVFQKVAGTGRTVRFGGKPLPNGQGTLPYINLNDWVSWFVQDIHKDTAQDLGLAPQLWRGRSVFISSDFPARSFVIPMEYRETVAPLGAVKPRLMRAGDQYLTFDTLTATTVRCAGFRNEQAIILAPQKPRWSFELEFACTQQSFFDLTPTTYINALALNSGTVTSTTLAYGGSVEAEPIYTLHVPASNTAPIASLRLQNTMSDNDMTVVFPGNLTGSTLWDITIDASTYSVTDATGKGYDVSGSFPLFYGPTGQVQQISATLTPASGTATGCTLTAVASNRWDL